MREIKFRGKLKDNPKIWVYGYFFSNGIHAGIIHNSGFPGQWNEVLPETVGEFTGLKDKNDVEIYEGDFLEFGKQLYLIGWDEHIAGFSWRNCLMETHLMFRKFVARECTYAGNKHDNPELLSGVK